MPIDANAAGSARLPGDLTAEERRLKTMVMIVYGLYIASLFVGVTSIIGVIIAHVKKGDAAGTIFESHFRNQISVFWIGLLVGIVGGITTIFLVGWLLLAFVVVWSLYRTIKGLIRANDDKAYV